nr:MAG TPA: hypothetical protein [Caudoviricetes sp.]
MLKITKTYEDWNGMERTEDFYFNLTEAEITELQIGTVGGFAETIEKIINAKEQSELIKLFKDLVLMAYGEKTADGRHFRKNDEVKNGFVDNPAYSIIFMELVSDAEKAAEFINGIMPKSVDKAELQKKTDELMAKYN